MSALATWRCPWCQRSNDRDHEGLDTCEHCGSEAATHYSRTDEDRLVVKWAREPLVEMIDAALARATKGTCA